ncbi:MAG: hypothetical protein KF799_12290 [Bdellovibrionales bacterium]|nr:hypothetical protein [Bdellovibrionales bacterium]
MRSLVFATLLISAGLPQMAVANKIIGNGGMVVVCASEPRVRLLDLYEAVAIQYQASSMPHLTLASPEGVDYEAKFFKIVDRITARFPDLGEQILREYKVFEAHRLIMPQVNLGDTNDDFHAILPLGCSLKQVAIQREPMFPRSPQLIISAELWNEMDALNRAALMLHESIYRIGIRNGLEHSLGVRYLVGLLMADELELISDEDWMAAFIQSRIPKYEIGNVKVPLFTGTFKPCRPSPGTATCTSTEVLKAADFTFGSMRRLKRVNYGDTAEILTFPAQNAVQVGLKVREMAFDWDRSHLELNGQGDMVMQMGDSQMVLAFSGAVRPQEGLFIGSQSIGSNIYERRVPPSKFVGSIARLLNSYGVSEVQVDNSRTASQPFWDDPSWSYMTPEVSLQSYRDLE